MARNRSAMSSVDTAWLRMESPANPMMIGAVLIFDQPIPLDGLRELLTERFLRFRRFRQRVICRNERHYWEDDPWFTLDNHLHVIALPGKGDQNALQALVSDLNSTPLDFNHPLWDIHYVDNYRGGCALIVRIHHCIADGISLVRVLLSLTDEQAAPETTERRDTARQPLQQWPEWRRVLHRVRRNLHLAGAQAEQALQSVRDDPRYLLRLAHEAWRVGSDLVQLTLAHSDPPTPLKGPLSGRKQVAWSEPLDLGEVKATAKALGGTINDVLTTAASGALHAFLRDGKGSIPDESIHVAVPFNLRPLDQPITRLGNQFGLVLLPLPVQRYCPRARFREVQSTMSDLKQSYQAQVSYGLLDILGRGPELLERRALEMLSEKASAVMTNVPGPGEALYLCGARLRQPMFWVPQTGNVGIGLSIFSYNGTVQFGIISDRSLIHSPEHVANAFADAFHELRDLVIEDSNAENITLSRPKPLSIR